MSLYVIYKGGFRLQDLSWGMGALIYRSIHMTTWVHKRIFNEQNVLQNMPIISLLYAFTLNFMFTKM